MTMTWARAIVVLILALGFLAMWVCEFYRGFITSVPGSDQAWWAIIGGMVMGGIGIALMFLYQYLDRKLPPQLRLF